MKGGEARVVHFSLERERRRGVHSCVNYRLESCPFKVIVKWL